MGDDSEEECRDRDVAWVTTEGGSASDQRFMERDGLWSGAADEEEDRRLHVVTIVR